MKQNVKWNSKVISLALVVVVIFIFLLTIRNYARFNDNRNVEAREDAIRDSIECDHIDCLSSTLNNVTTQLDSIKNNQNMGNEIVARDMDSIKQSLKHIERTERQILNSIK